MTSQSDPVYNEQTFTGGSFKREEQVRLLYMQAPVSNSVIIIIATLYYFLLRSRLDSNLLLTWTSLLIVLSFYRLCLWYSQKKNAETRSPKAWLNLYMAGCGLIGVGWSLIFPFLASSSDTIVFSSLLILAFGVMSSAIPILSACLPAFVFYTYPQGLSLVITLTSMEDIAYFWLAFAVVIYLVMITLFARNTNRSILHSIHLQEQNRSLINDLNLEINQRESLITKRTSELKKKNEDLLVEMQVRKSTEEELRNSEKKFKTIFENSPLAMVHFNENGVVTACNDLLCTIMGAPREKILNLRALKSIKDEQMLSAIKNALAGRIGNFEGKYVSVTGNAVSYIKGNFGPVYSAQGSIAGAIGILEDISESYKVKKEKEQLEAQLQQAQKLEAIGTLAGGVAHEFNNMLAIIMGNNEIVKKQVAPESLARECANEIKIAGIRAREVVKQLLTFSRQDDAVQKAMNLTTVVKESMNLIRSSIPSNVRIEQNLSTETYPVIGNDTQINQLLINLCNNAVDALPESGGIISVDLCNLSIDPFSQNHQGSLKTGEYAKLVVSDNGTGMSAEVVSRIFEPYFTTKDFGEGTGIGMAVVHGIVEKHGGEILVDSRPQQGTTFSIYLPAYHGLLEQEKDLPEESLPVGNENILFVDDEESLAKLSEKLLGNLGYSITSTTDPEEALNIIRMKPDKFDLLITDMAMPTMTGEQLIEKTLKIRPDMQTIICTGYSSRISEKNVLNMGVGGYLLKPINTAELASMVRRTLDEANGQLGREKKISLVSN